MIFVHSRKDASRTADTMRDLSAKNGTTHLLENVHHEQYGVWKRAVDKSRSQEVSISYMSHIAYQVSYIS